MNIRLAFFTMSFFNALLTSGTEREYTIELVADAAWKVYRLWSIIALGLAHLTAGKTTALAFAISKHGEHQSDVSLRFPFNALGYFIEPVTVGSGTAFDVVRCPIADYFTKTKRSRTRRPRNLISWHADAQSAHFKQSLIAFRRCIEELSLQVTANHRIRRGSRTDAARSRHDRLKWSLELRQIVQVIFGGVISLRLNVVGTVDLDNEHVFAFCPLPIIRLEGGNKCGPVVDSLHHRLARIFLRRFQ
ncbi:MAG: hypothetical protein WA374_05225 [Acidobacteriaceae bacterium]